MLEALKKTYDRSPLLLKRAYACIPFGVRMGRIYRETRRFLAESQSWSQQDLRAYQDKQIKALVKHAYENVLYYRRVMDQHGLRASDIKKVSALSKMPLLTKDAIKKNFKQAALRKWRSWNTFFATAGGTTGVPLGLSFSNNCYAQEWAFIHDLWSRVGYKPSDRKATFRGRQVKLKSGKVYLHNPIYNELCFSVYHLEREWLSEHVKAYREWHPAYVHGYPSAIHRFARLVKEFGLALPEVRAVLATSEQLYEEQREEIGSVLGGRVFSWYGLTEKAILAGECESSSLYHVYPQYGVTEILRADGSPCEAGEVGELVGTGFLTGAMPLIRYRTGDFAAWSDGFCASCGRQYPVLEKVIGRVQDHIVTISGRLIPVTGMLFGAHLPEYAKVDKIQLEQRNPGLVVVRLVPGSQCTSKELRRLLSAFEETCEGECKFTVERVSHIQRTDTGKYRYLIQHMDIEETVQSEHVGVAQGSSTAQS